MKYYNSSNDSVAIIDSNISIDDLTSIYNIPPLWYQSDQDIITALYEFDRVSCFHKMTVLRLSLYIHIF